MFNFLYYVKSTFLGLITTIKHILKKAVTVKYPEVKPELNEKFRGLHTLKNCLGCGKCKQVCPVDAIDIQRLEKGFRYFIDLGKCIFCGNCQYFCPVQAIKLSGRYELATDDRDKLFYEVTKEW